MSCRPHTSVLPCARCGYDLVGIDASVPCPECQLDAAAARAPMPLATLKPLLVRRLVWMLAFASVVWLFDGLWNTINWLSPSISSRLSIYIAHPSAMVRILYDLTWTLPTPVIAIILSVCAMVLVRVHAVNAKMTIAFMWVASALVAAAFIGNQWPSMFFHGSRSAFDFEYSIAPLFLLWFPFAAGVALRACAGQSRSTLGKWLLVLAVAVGMGVIGQTYLLYTDGRPRLFDVPHIPRAIGRRLGIVFACLSCFGSIALGILILLLARHIHRVVLPRSEPLHAAGHAS